MPSIFQAIECANAGIRHAGSSRKLIAHGGSSVWLGNFIESPRVAGEVSGTEFHGKRLVEAALAVLDAGFGSCGSLTMISLIRAVTEQLCFGLRIPLARNRHSRHVPASVTAGNAWMTGARAAPTAREARRPIRRESVGRPIAEFANPPPSDPDLDAFLTDACVISC